MFDNEVADWLAKDIDRPYLVAGAVAALSIIYFELLAGTTVNNLSRTAFYFLAVAAGMLVLWGTWGVMIDRNDVRDSLVYATIAVAGVSSLGVLVLIELEGADNLGRRLVADMWLLAAYIGGAVALAEYAGGVVRSFLPHLLGHDDFSLSFPSTPTPFEWRGVISVGALAIGLVALFGLSLIEAIGNLRKDEKIAVRRSILLQKRIDATNPLELLAVNIEILILDLQRGALAAAQLVALTAEYLVRSFRDTLARFFKSSMHLFRLLVAPILGFSLIALCLMYVLTQFSDPTTDRGSMELWAEAFTLGTVMWMVSYLAFSTMSDRDSFAEIIDIFLLGWIAWFGMTILATTLSLLLWAGLQFVTVDSDILNAAIPGQVLLINLAFVLGVFAFELVVAWERMRLLFNDRIKVALLVLPVFAPTVVAMAIGAPLIVSGFRDAM